MSGDRWTGMLKQQRIQGTNPCVYLSRRQSILVQGRLWELVSSTSRNHGCEAGAGERVPAQPCTHLLCALLTPWFRIGILYVLALKYFPFLLKNIQLKGKGMRLFSCMEGEENTCFIRRESRTVRAALTDFSLWNKLTWPKSPGELIFVRVPNSCLSLPYLGTSLPYQQNPCRAPGSLAHPSFRQGACSHFSFMGLPSACAWGQDQRHVHVHDSGIIPTTTFVPPTLSRAAFCRPVCTSPMESLLLSGRALGSLLPPFLPRELLLP